MDRNFSSMNTQAKESEMGLYRLPDPILRFKNDEIRGMKTMIGHLDPAHVYIFEPLRNFASEFFEGLLRRTEFNGNCRLKRG